MQPSNAASTLCKAVTNSVTHPEVTDIVVKSPNTAGHYWKSTKLCGYLPEQHSQNVHGSFGRLVLSADFSQFQCSSSRKLHHDLLASPEPVPRQCM